MESRDSAMLVRRDPAETRRSPRCFFGREINVLPPSPVAPELKLLCPTYLVTGAVPGLSDPRILLSRLSCMCCGQCPRQDCARPCDYHHSHRLSRLA